jgi:hypothetical protein
MRRTTTFIAGALALLAVPAVAVAQTVTLTHVHGLGYSADGKRLLIASHDGIAVYGDGGWSMASARRDDYMGFTATHDYFYSSGHPAPASRLVNPLGLIRSANGGVKWDKLGFEGESDFHLLAAGYRSNAIYLYNPEPNRRMKTPGIYSTLNEGFAWRRAEAQGLEGKIAALAVHPTDAKTVAVATSSGLFLSRDGGERFARIAGNGQGLTAYFAFDGHNLWFASYDSRPHLFRIDLGTRGAAEIALPPLVNDAVAYISQNPASPSHYAIATFERNVYITADAGGQWRQIGERGRTKP